MTTTASAMAEIRPVFVVGSLVAACSASVLRCPEPGESLRASGFIMEAGGKGFNVALAAHRLGIPVEGLFAVGDDALGLFMRDAFARVGLRPDLITTVAGATGAGIGIIEANGENRIAVFPGANDRLSAKEVAAASEALRSAALVVAQYEAPDAPIAAAFALARQAGVPTLLNPSPYRAISTEILGMTDIMVVNEGEAQALLGDLSDAGRDEDDAEEPYAGLANALARWSVATVIVTLGNKGAILWRGGACIRQAAFPVEAVDSIGAGDAFIGGLVAALVRQSQPETGLRWGCAAGALTVARLGLIDALPGPGELFDFLGVHA